MTTVVPVAERAQPEPRSDYRYLRKMSLQWRDNDVYGHVNNAVHYAWFDSVVNGWLLERGLLTVGNCAVVGLVVSSRCQYSAEVAFPDRVLCGLRVGRVGRTSVRYELGLFRNEDLRSFATGELVHVYVGWPSRRPVPHSVAMQDALRDLERAHAST